MQAQDINKTLNKPVIYNGDTYILTGIIKRIKDNKYYYQAEIKDKCKNSVSICKLEDVEADNE